MLIWRYTCIPIINVLEINKYHKGRCYYRGLCQKLLCHVLFVRVCCGHMSSIFLLISWYWGDSFSRTSFLYPHWIQLVTPRYHHCRSIVKGLNSLSAQFPRKRTKTSWQHYIMYRKKESTHTLQSTKLWVGFHRIKLCKRQLLPITETKGDDSTRLGFISDGVSPK